VTGEALEQGSDDEAGDRVAYEVRDGRGRSAFMVGYRKGERSLKSREDEYVQPVRSGVETFWVMTYVGRRWYIVFKRVSKGEQLQLSQGGR
jgi:hypothetical protein